MKTTGVILLLLVCLTTRGQDLGIRLARYEAQKKDIGTALLFSTLLPGGGLFYTGETTNGVAFLSFETVNLLLFFERRNSGDSYGIYIATLIVLKAFEYGFAIRDVERYNEQLRVRFGLMLSVGPRGEPRVIFSLNF
jgi:hypothetical protein